ncbi:alpha,alpha-trehalase TreF [Hyphomonas pacifica]|uniref:alpha,alpha-trehalase TreF n=1 Tax=Hyphomonas pacifica TaxID=1280941 RepID=UPI000DD37ACC|nr:alpha,alpha-trehalase TreF [Hyphomonas pacifica]
MATQGRNGVLIGLAAFLLNACQQVTPVAVIPAQPVLQPSALAERDPPSLAYPGLFQRVALSGLVDPKDWVDAKPKLPPPLINEAYAEARPQTREDLAEFIDTYFDLPDNNPITDDVALAADLSLRKHIEALWPHLTRNADDSVRVTSLIPLPHPYIVPGGRFREVYYWDAYFTMTGLGPGHDDIKQSMVDNFAWLIRETGHVPNANRTYYLSRSQPPFFFAMVGLLSPGDEAAAWADYLPELKAEYAFWMQGERAVTLQDGNVLNRYWDGRDVPRDESFIQDTETAHQSDRPKAKLYRELRAGAESGWDFSSRWLEDPKDLSTIQTTRILPVDLNALLYGLELAIAAGCEQAEDPVCNAAFMAKAEARKAAMNIWLWDEARGVFGDYDLDATVPTQRDSAASLYPLFLGLATQTQADRTAAYTAEHLLAPGGLMTTPLNTGQQWDAPNGWAPLHWIAVKGLEDYGHVPLADDIAERWLTTVSRTYCETGKLVEKYDVVTVRPGGGGEYPLQDGFGWTNGVTAALIDTNPNYSAYGDTMPGETCERYAQTK